MGQIPRSGKPDSVTAVSRRAVLGAGASVGLATAAVDWPDASLRPIAANAADPMLADRSSRQLAAFQVRQAPPRKRTLTHRRLCTHPTATKRVMRTNELAFQRPFRTMTTVRL